MSEFAFNPYTEWKKGVEAKARVDDLLREQYGKTNEARNILKQTLSGAVPAAIGRTTDPVEEK